MEPENGPELFASAFLSFFPLINNTLSLSQSPSLILPLPLPFLSPLPSAPLVPLVSVGGTLELSIGTAAW
jgi:hypothetical protein